MMEQNGMIPCKECGGIGCDQCDKYGFIPSVTVDANNKSKDAVDIVRSERH